MEFIYQKPARNVLGIHAAESDIVWRYQSQVQEQAQHIGILTDIYREN